jgi:hypothetical protein
MMDDDDDDDDDECRAIGEMLGKGNRSTRRKPLGQFESKQLTINVLQLTCY